MSYILKLFDEPLAEFEMVSSGRELTVEVTRIHDGASSKLPLDWSDGARKGNLEAAATDLASWLKHRSIPSNRAYVGNFLAKLGMSERDVERIISLCKGLSLNDCYWVAKDDDRTPFDKVNLYQNRFSRVIAQLAFTGSGSRGTREFYSTPELTTDGTLAKCWRRDKGAVYLYKEGSLGARNAGNEPYAEFYAAQIADAMGIAHVPYAPTQWNGHFCSRCPLFTNLDHGFISASRLVRTGGIDAVEGYYRNMGASYRDAFADMLAFDALTCNIDRHFGNFGFMVDNRENRICSPAPLFDHGLSLLPFAMEDDYATPEDLDEYARTQLPKTYDDFFERARESMGKAQKDKVRRILEFSFKKHSRYNWPDERLKTLEMFVRERARRLL